MAKAGARGGYPRRMAGSENNHAKRYLQHSRPHLAVRSQVEGVEEGLRSGKIVMLPFESGPGTRRLRRRRGLWSRIKRLFRRRQLVSNITLEVDGHPGPLPPGEYSAKVVDVKFTRRRN